MGEIAKGSHDAPCHHPCMYRPCMEDVSDNESEDEYEDTASAAGDTDSDADE